MRAPPLRLLLALLAAVLLGHQARAEDGVFPDRVVFGQAAPLTGPAAALGTGMRDGIRAAFAEANRAGGVAGRKLDLVSADDGYDPNTSIEATRKLIEGEHVLALIGPVGTPTSAATQPIAAAAGVPFIGPFTGAEFLRAADKANVINLRASYFQETEAMVAHLTADLDAKRIAILYQDDAYGRAGLEGVKRALARRSMELAAEGTYERNTVAVKGAVIAIRKAAPDAVIMIGAYKPCAEFIRLARTAKLDATFVNISFVGSEALAAELGAAGQGVVVTQVVPFPTDATDPMAASYRAALGALDPALKPGFVSYEGYLVGRLAVAALDRAGPALTRAALLAAFRGAPIDLAGTKLTFTAEHNQGGDRVFLTVLQADGSFKPVAALTRAGS